MNLQSIFAKESPVLFRPLPIIIHFWVDTRALELHHVTWSYLILSLQILPSGDTRHHLENNGHLNLFILAIFAIIYPLPLMLEQCQFCLIVTRCVYRFDLESYSAQWMLIKININLFITVCFLSPIIQFWQNLLHELGISNRQNNIKTEN